MGRGSVAPAAVMQIQTMPFLPLAYEFKKATKDPSNTHAYPVHTLEAGLALGQLAGLPGAAGTILQHQRPASLVLALAACS